MYTFSKLKSVNFLKVRHLVFRSDLITIMHSVNSGGICGTSNENKCLLTLNICFLSRILFRRNLKKTYKVNARLFVHMVIGYVIALFVGYISEPLLFGSSIVNIEFENLYIYNLYYTFDIKPVQSVLVFTAAKSEINY